MIETAISSNLEISMNELMDAKLVNSINNPLANKDDEDDSKDHLSDKSASNVTFKSNEKMDLINEIKQKQTNKEQEENKEQLNSNLIIGNQVKCGQLFGPFTDPIQWLAIRHSTTKHSLPKEFCSLEPDLLALFRSIQMANSADEQNMEIIVKNNKFYFRALQTVDLSVQTKTKNENQNTNLNNEISNKDKNNDTIESLNEKPLFSWFSNELSARLPVPAVSMINGNKRYFCTKCNQVFIYPNPTILHILFACTSTANTPINSTERLASPSGRLDNNNLSLSMSNNFENSLNKSLQINNNNINASLNSAIVTTNNCTELSPTISNSSINNSPICNSSSINNSLSYTPLNGSISLANSKILKNLEAKLCKQFQSSISSDHNNNSNNSNKSTSGQSLTKSNKPSKKRAFDIDSLVNNVEQPPINNKKHKLSNDSEQKTKNSNKNENSSKLFKTPLSTLSLSSQSKQDNLTNSTLINTLNSPLVNTAAVNGLTNPSLFNPFSLLDPTNLASSLSPSAFHKFENMNSANKSFLNGNSLPDQASLLNAAMFGASPVTALNFTNSFDLASLYAQHQRNLIQSMFNQQQNQTAAGQLSSTNNPSSSSLNYIQNLNNLTNQLSSAATTNPLFASQNLTNLSTLNSLSSLNSLNSLNNFNGLSSLLMNPSSSGLISSGLPSSLTNSLFGLTGPNAFNQQVQQPSTTLTNQSNFNSSTLLDSFVVPQQSPIEKNTNKKKKNSNKDLNNNSNLNSKSSNQSQQNATNNSTNSNNANRNSSSLAPSLTSQLNSKSSPVASPSYLQFLPPSLAALSCPQSNWCAKCNISFRMTSDLVYHMRSQHKETNSNGIQSGNEQNPNSKRKREENKLFCTICGEGFKERHHLTRHMISH